jgi:hypothetical protein
LVVELKPVAYSQTFERRPKGAMGWGRSPRRIEPSGFLLSHLRFIIPAHLFGLSRSKFTGFGLPLDSTKP